MNESQHSRRVAEELSQLEQAGRVSARDHRPVHKDFGFASIAPSPLSQPETSAAVSISSPVSAEPAAQPTIAGQIDDAWSRLKQRIEPN
ncbi:MAG: hypothetical protein ACPGWS_00635 [Solirubrobacterales bacterium]